MNHKTNWVVDGLLVVIGMLIGRKLSTYQAETRYDEDREEIDAFFDSHHYDKNEIRKGCDVFKVFSDKTGAEEPMWMFVESVKGDKVCGILVNTPGTVSMHFGQKVCARKKDILRTSCAAKG